MIRRSVGFIAAAIAAILIVPFAPPAQAQIDILRDFGDLPLSYGTASHDILNAGIPYWMGDIVLGFDPDGGHQESTDALADDCHTAEGDILPVGICIPIVEELLSDQDNYILDDEDGVAISGLVPGGPANVAMEATDDGFFSGWVDFTRDGDFGDAGEQIFASVPVNAGLNTGLNFQVPVNMGSGVVYSRFRFASSAAAIASPAGNATDGEVEDYQLAVNMDLGDAPDDPADATDYPTVIASDGARHRISTLRMGGAIDTDPDGQPNPTATGDDLDAEGDDEDGVTFGSSFVRGSSTTVVINSNESAFVDAWIDFNRNENWNDPGEHVLVDSPVNAGNNAKTIPVGAGAVDGLTFARFRISKTTAGVTSPTGVAPDGEVEDYANTISPPGVQPMDFGDAPDAVGAPVYPTLLANNGARHLVQGTQPLRLGVNIDTEGDGQPNATATGDDINPPAGPDDEDGVVFLTGTGASTTFVPGRQSSVRATTNGPGSFDGWIDANHDGDWEDNGEHVIDSEELPAGTSQVDFTMPGGSTFGDTYARFRYSSSGQNAPEGFVNDGEVEDYRVAVTLECGATVTGNFVLPFDMNCPGNGPSDFGLFVGADRTVIDLNGHTISGNGLDADTGIANREGVATVQDVTITDNSAACDNNANDCGEVVDFGTGIDIDGDRLTITNIGVRRNHGPAGVGVGILVVGIDTHIENVRVTNNDNDGIRNTGHNLEVINSNVSQNSGEGVQFIGRGATVSGSTINENGGTGVFGDGQDSTVTASDISRNSGSGVVMVGTNALVSENTINDNLTDGVNINGTRSRVIDNDSIANNGAEGINASGDSGLVSNNGSVDSNAGDGIHLLQGFRWIVTFNIALNNGDDGIDVESLARGTVSRNLLRRGNEHFAIEAHRRVKGKNNQGGPCKPSKLCKRRR